jgi:ubiquinone/menaquinone biosynthesis C-methylase UbiE
MSYWEQADVQLSADDPEKTGSVPVLDREFSLEGVEKEYSHVARILYNLWARLTESKAVNRGVELANICDGEAVLEVAVGTGIAFKKIVERNKHGRNEGVDISPAMLSAAVRRMERCEIDCCRLQAGNAYSLPFDDGKFDVLINNYMLDLLPESDLVSILKEFRRVLRSQGRLVVVTIAFGRKWYNHFWFWIAKHFPWLLTNCRPVLIDAYMTAAGFKNIKLELVSQNTFPSQIVVATKA